MQALPPVAHDGQGDRSRTGHSHTYAERGSFLLTALGSSCTGGGLLAAWVIIDAGV